MNAHTGKIIKDRLRELGKTQGWLAEAIGVSDNAASKWIRGGSISREKLQAVAKLLGLTVDQLLGGGGEIAPAERGEQTWLERLTADEKEMLELYRTRSREGQLMAKGAIKAAPEAPNLSVIRHKP